MPAVTSLLAASAVLGGGAALYGAYQQSEAQKAQSEFERDQYNTNAQIAGMQSNDALKRGADAANAAVRQGRQVEGAQRVALASQGIDVNSGSAADVLQETQDQTHQDFETIKNNAWREAWGFKTQAVDMANRGKLAYTAGQNAARNTLIMGGINAAGSFAQAGAYAAKGGGGGGAKASSGNSDVPSSDSFQQPDFGSSLKRKPKYLNY